MKDYIKYLVLIFIVLLIIAVPVVLFFVSNFNQSAQGIDTPVVINNSTENVSNTIDNSRLRELVDDNFKNDDSYAVVIKNLETGEEYKFNEKKEFYSASLYKLWILGVAMQQLDDGIIDKEELVSGDKKKLDNILNPLLPTPSIEGAPPEDKQDEKPELISFVVEDAIERMITKSDNYAALLMSQKVSYKEIDKFLEKYNFTNSSYDSPPKTNAEDIALFFEFLYEGKIKNEEISKEMLEILKRQEWDDRIPKYLPEELDIAHKTGELFGNKHDAGIVFSSKGDYIIVVLSKTESEAIAAEKIAKFSEDIYNYFEEN